MSEKKLAVTIWNYKGGVGKSTLSLILAQTAAISNLKVMAIDLDEQKNLAETLSLSSSVLKNNIEIRTELKSEFADENFNLYVIDTHPAKNDVIIDALNFADIILVPVLGDYHSVINLRSVFDYIHFAGVGENQAALVKNCMSSKLKVTGEVESVLDEQGYEVAGRLPRSNNLLRNIASGNLWYKYMSEKQKMPFMNLYKNIWRAYDEMAKGNFRNIWNK